MTFLFCQVLLRQILFWTFYTLQWRISQHLLYVLNVGIGLRVDKQHGVYNKTFKRCAGALESVKLWLPARLNMQPHHDEKHCWWEHSGKGFARQLVMNSKIIVSKVWEKKFICCFCSLYCFASVFPLCNSKALKWKKKRREACLIDLTAQIYSLTSNEPPGGLSKFCVVFKLVC